MAYSLKLKILFLVILFLIPLVSAETTFFENPNDFLILTEITEEQIPVEEDVVMPEMPGGKKVPKEKAAKIPEEQQIEEALFDVIVSTLPDSEIIYPDSKKASFKIDLIKFGLPQERTKVNITYTVYKEDELIYEETEILEVQKEMSFIKSIMLLELIPGTYEFNAKILYGENKTAEGKTTFIVKEKEQKFFNSITGKLVLAVLLVIFIAGIGIIVIVKRKNGNKPKKEKF